MANQVCTETHSTKNYGQGRKLKTIRTVIGFHFSVIVEKSLIFAKSSISLEMKFHKFEAKYVTFSFYIKKCLTERNIKCKMNAAR